LAFAAREALGRGGVRRYPLRHDGLQFTVRHGVGDAWIVDEVFNRAVYDAPADVRRVLDALARPLRIVDLGAHVGAVTLRYLTRHPGSTVVAFEPNRESGGLLRATLEHNGLADRCTIVEAAAGAADGEAYLEGVSVLSHVVREGEAQPDHLGAFAEQFAGRRQAIRIVDVLPYLADADLLKMDIEGGEWDILRDPRFAASALKAVVLEFHNLGAPGGNARTGVIDALAAAGFTVGEPFDERHGEGLVWAFRS
jgi:FkbM family methyltransferase